MGQRPVRVQSTKPGRVAGWQRGQNQESMPLTPAVRSFEPQRGQVVLAPHLQEVPNLHVDRLAAARDLGDGLSHHADDRVVQPHAVLVRERAAEGLRVDAGLEQHLVGVGVAQAVEGLLVQQEDAHLVAAVLEDAHEALARELGGQDVDAARLHAGHRLPVLGRDQVGLAHLLVVEVAQLDVAEAEGEAEACPRPGRRGSKGGSGPPASG